MKTGYNIVFKAFRESINLEFYAQLNYYSRVKVKKETCSDIQRLRVLTNHRLNNWKTFSSAQKKMANAGPGMQENDNRQHIAKSKWNVIIVIITSGSWS